MRDETGIPTAALAVDLSGGDAEGLRRQSEAVIPTPHGRFRVIAYAAVASSVMPNLALVAEGTDTARPTLLRLHSECLTGDIFHSRRCDCGEQLDEAMRLAGREGGVILYLRQEGRGIGIINKLRAYGLQDRGADTVEANELLGLPVDGRDYSAALAMARDLGLRQVRLLTNNPLKVDAFAGSGVEVVERRSLEIPKRPENERYLNTKRDEMGHAID